MNSAQAEQVCPHGAKLSPLKPCRECLANPPALPATDIAAATDPQETADEQRARDVADACFDRADELQKHRKKGEAGESVDHIGENVICKLRETGLKALRLALDIADKRKDREHDRWLVEQDRDLAGMRGSH